MWDETDVYNADYPRAYVIPVDGTQRSVSDAETLVAQLLALDLHIGPGDHAEWLAAYGLRVPMLSDYLPILILAALAVVFAVASLVASSLPDFCWT